MSYNEMRSGLRRRASSTKTKLRSLLHARPLPAILMYHRFSQDSFDPWGLSVSPANFFQHLEWLSHNRTVLPLADFAVLHRHRSLPRDAIAVTIDDGYSCFSDVAAPLLEQFRVHATVFLPVDLIERRRPFWWDELEEIVLGHEHSTLTLDGVRIPLGERRAEDRRWEARAAPVTHRQFAFQDVLTCITRKTPSERDRAMKDIRRQAGGTDQTQCSKRPMSPEQVRLARNEFVEFGSHTLRHPWLTLLDTQEQSEEVCGSIDRLQSLTGRRPAAFAYPYGASDKHSREVVEAAGFQCACVTGDSAVSSGNDVFALPRVRVGDCDAAGLAHLLASVPPA